MYLSKSCKSALILKASRNVNRLPVSLKNLFINKASENFREKKSEISSYWT